MQSWMCYLCAHLLTRIYCTHFTIQETLHQCTVRRTRLLRASRFTGNVVQQLYRVWSQFSWHIGWNFARIIPWRQQDEELSFASESWHHRWSQSLPHRWPGSEVKKQRRKYTYTRRSTASTALSSQSIKLGKNLMWSSAIPKYKPLPSYPCHGGRDLFVRHRRQLKEKGKFDEIEKNLWIFEEHCIRSEEENAYISRQKYYWHG